MAKASRLLLLLATIALFLLAIIMLLNSDSEFMAIPLIGISVLAGFGYTMFDANEPDKPKSTPEQLNTIELQVLKKSTNKRYQMSPKVTMMFRFSEITH